MSVFDFFMNNILQCYYVSRKALVYILWGHLTFNHYNCTFVL